MQNDLRYLLVGCIPCLVMVVAMIALREFIAYTRAITGERLPLRRTGFDGMIGRSQKRYRELFAHQKRRARPSKQAANQYVASPPPPPLPPPNTYKLPPTQAAGIQLSAQDFSHTGFEKYVGALFEQNGFAVVHTGQTNDGGVDLKIYKNGKKGIVQCKHYDDKKVGPEFVRDLRGAIIREAAIAGFLITSSQFTAAAIDEAAAVKSPRIVLVDGVRLAEWAKTGKIP
jgi:hypothetical protein